jgi:acyl-CoA synthetase (AMP-forming)/AMP-acid ligase II
MCAALASSRLLGDRLEYWADTTPDREALAFGDQRWTWAQWRDRIRRAAAGLAAAGIGPGDRVAFLDRNHPACLEITFAAASIGAANTVVNWRLAPAELDYVLNDSGARILFAGPDRLSTLKPPTVEKTIVVGDDYERWLAGYPPIAPEQAVTDDETCLVLYTSGTTGVPKGAMLTHRGVIAHTVAISAVFPFAEGDRNLVAMPLFHVGGTCYAMIGVHAGVPTTITRDPDAASLFAALAAGATHAFLVPPVISGILQAGDRAIAAFSRLKYLGYGASPMPLPALRAALAAWPQTNFIQVYGMTELSGVVTALGPQAHRDEAHPQRLASAGTALPGVHMRVADPSTGKDVAEGAQGELWFRTSQRMAGYWGNAEATAQTITPDGWLRSGDVGWVDEEGFVYIVDRVKDMIITGGENVYSPEVERVLAEHPAVGDVAVIGIPDDRWGESVLALVTASAGQSVDEAELIAYCRERLAHYKCPRAVVVVGELPRTATGKILKRDLRSPYWAGRERKI